MRLTLARLLTAVAGLWAFQALTPEAAAQIPPCHQINKHPPFWTRSCCSCCYRAYGLYGMHDAFPAYPPGPVMPPAIPPRYLGSPYGAGAGQGQMWFRSPRDFYMQPGY
jgi:hypothetical protein